MFHAGSGVAFATAYPARLNVRRRVMHWITETPARDGHPRELSQVPKVTFGYLFQ